jgi:hypothetical protein
VSKLYRDVIYVIYERYYTLYLAELKLYVSKIRYLWERIMYVLYMYSRVYNYFTNLVPPGRWWLQNLILRHIYKKKFQPFRLRLHSKSVKSANMTKKNFALGNMGIKKQSLMLISNTLKTLLKISWEKSYQRKSDRKMSFCFYYWVQKFLAYNYFRWYFYTFFNGFKLSIKFFVYYTCINFLKLCFAYRSTLC